MHVRLPSCATEYSIGGRADEPLAFHRQLRLADVFEAFVKEVRGRAPIAPPEPPESLKGSPLPPHRYPKKRR
jgi:hypothetical protein